MAKNVLAAYLDRYADDAERTDSPAGRKARRKAGRRAARYVVVIPAFDEAIEDLPLCGRDDVLTIVVANVPDHLDRDDPRVRRTAELFSELASIDGVLAIDHVTRPIPKRQGVGLARKIGCDTAARLIARGQIEHPVIFSTDADVRLPDEYFEATEGFRSATTWVYPFRHRATVAEFSRPIALYEAHMRYYVHALDQQASPYAYHSLGSLVAVHVDAYAAVRGFPKKNAGEDFYLLNKLAKVAPITRLTAPVIPIEARPSERVPFGTGPAIRKIQIDQQTKDDYLSYDRRAFDIVGELFDSARQRTLPAPDSNLARIIDQLGYREALTRLTTQADPTLRHFHTWFDGFRTMKTVRAARAIFPDVRLGDSLAALFPSSADPWLALRNTDLERDGQVGVAAFVPLAIESNRFWEGPRSTRILRAARRAA